MSRRVSVGLTIAATILASTVIPFAFPPSQPSIGVSYEMGFDNRVAFILYAILVLVAASRAASLLPPPKMPVLADRWDLWPRRSRWILTGILAAHLLVFTGMYAYRGRFVFAEATYFEAMLYRLGRGELPFVDFGFYYGPTMLYPAHWLGVVLGADGGYGVWFIASYLAGVAMLFAILHRLLRRPEVADAWFVAIAVGLFSPLTGLNVTFFRYLLPTVVFLVAYDAARAQSRRSVLAAGALAGFAIAYSFEAALMTIGGLLLIVLAGLFDRLPLIARATAGSSSAPAGRLRIGPQRGGAVLLLGVLFALAALVAVDPRGRALVAYPSIALSYGSGAHNIPVYPSVPFLLLLGVTLTALAVAVRSAMAMPQAVSAAWPLVGLAAVALATEAAALSTFEIGHIAYFGLPALILAAHGIDRYGSAALDRALLLGALLCWSVPLQYYHVVQLAPAVLPAARSESVPAVLSASSAGRGNVESSIGRLVRQVGTDRPFFMPGLEYYSLPIYRRDHLRYPTYESYLPTARNATGIARVIAEIRTSEGIVIMRSGDLAGGQTVNPGGSLLDLLANAQTSNWPLTPVAERNLARLYAPFVEFLRNEYRVIAEGDGLVVLGPRGR